MLSIGFTSQPSQVNDSILFDYCFNYLNASVNSSGANNQSETSSAGIKDLKIIDEKNDNLTASASSHANLNMESHNKAGFDDSTLSSNKQGKFDSLATDTTKNHFDSTASKVDTTLRAKVEFLDSTARIEQFHYQREDHVYTEFTPPKRSKFFAYPSPSLFTRSVSLDSTGNFVIIKETIAGEEPKILLRIPLDEYIKLRLKANNRDLWEQLAYKYELKSEQKDLGQLLTDITNIDIPLPSVGFLSIFGPPVINLRIGGAVDIHGAWRSETSEGVTANLLGNTRNEPDFKQQVQINVNGTIGDKLTIGADWNTERTFEYENQLKIKYKGYPDEIVQSVEAGNVALQTSPLVGGSDALFGVKAQFQFGPLFLTALASQKKGEIKEVSVSGGSTSQDFSLHAYQYSKNHYFLDAVYADTTKYNIFNKYYGNPIPVQDHPEYFVKEIEVWKTKTGLRDNGQERLVNAYINLEYREKNNLNYPDSLRGDVAAVPGNIETGRFVKLTQDVDYVLHPETGYITFKTQIQETDAIAVAYQIEWTNQNSSDDDHIYGEFIKNETVTDSTRKLILKLVKPQNLRPQDKEAWSLQLKNIYPIGGRSINEEGFQLDIQYIPPGSDPQNQINGIPLLNAFGLDIYGEGGVTGKDGKFDFRRNKTIFDETGEIIFPVLQPFGRSLPKNLPDSLRYNDDYDTTSTWAQNQANKDRLLIVGKYSGSSSSVFNLGFTGVVENSVKVRLGVLELKEGVDYVVDYNIGQVTIKNPAALVPGADLKITYEQNDLFQLASKTLLGLRGEFNFSPKTVLGFSALNLNQQTLSDKVRIGEEPLNNSIYGVDFKTAVDLPFLTKGISTIIPTKTMSTLSLQGEYAYINPDPNTKTSTITGDNGQSIAYIDDFEGAKKTIPIGLSYTSWHDLSIPNVSKKSPLTDISDSAKSVQMYYKGKSWWYTKIPSDVGVKDIWGNRKQVATQDQWVTVMDYVFDPGQRGAYNYKPRLDDPTKVWGGMMKQLSSTATNLVEENIDFIEFWINLSYINPKDKISPPAKLYIDLGKISEDIIPNVKLDSEDKNENGLIDQGEDIGIDGLTDAQERQKYNSNEPDPSRDDYNFSLSGDNTDYSNINGTEGNAVSIDAGRFPDTEDLNGNLTLDQLDSYFRYSIPLDSNSTTNPYITSGANSKGWYQFRIPLKDFIAQIGDPSFSNVDFIRLWVTGVSEPVHIRLVEFDLAGNQWQKVVSNNNAEDSTLTLSVANYEDNSPIYYLPPGLTQERDRTNPDQNVLRNEQSLSLILNNLKDGEERQVVKFVRSMDLFNYREMKLFIHGDERPGYTISEYKNKDTLAAEAYFRFGSDTTNYYEYRLPVKKGWIDLSIKFDEITALKVSADTANKSGQSEVPGAPGHYYRVKGNPSLTKISFFMVGVSNPGGKGITTPVSGDVWVNELRVIGADNSPGWAYSASGRLNFGDIFTVNFNMSQTNPNFHRLSDRFGSRLDSRNWGVNVDLDVLKLLPFNLPGSNLKINYARTEQLSTPVYRPGTDIKVDKAAEELQRKGVSSDSINSFIQSTRSVNTSETWTLSGMRIKIPSSFFLINYFVNDLQWGFNFNKTFGRSPTVQYSNSWLWNATLAYQVSLSQNNFFYPADLPLIGTIVDLFSDYRKVRFYYTPQSFSWNLTATRNYSYTLARGANVLPLTNRDFKSTRSLSFQWKLTEGGLLNLGLSYNFNFASSLAHLLTDDGTTNGIPRSESQIWKDIFTKDFFGRDFQFQQSVDLRSSPKLPNIWDINRYFTINWGYGSSYSWQNNFQQEELGRSAGFSNKVNASLQIRLKSLTEPLFKEEEAKETNKLQQPEIKPRERTPGNEPRTGRGREDRRLEHRAGEESNIRTDSLREKNTVIKPDSLVNENKKLEDSLNAAKAEEDSLKSIPTEPKLKLALQAVKAGIKWLFFDYETIQFNFSNDNSVQKSGIQGTGSGIANFWGLFQRNENGPSRAFMLGFSQDVGQRAYIPHSLNNSNLTDNFSQRNSVDFKTSRPLWEGASLDLSWKVNWQISKSSTIQTDSLGNTTVVNPTSTGSITRSFIALPPIPLLSFIKGGIKRVNELYDPAKNNISDAFRSGFESLPIISNLPFLKAFAKYIPRPNWSFNWDGLEKYSIFKSWTKRVSLSHAYTSEYTEGWRIDASGTQITQSQKVSYGFSPLIGINLTFNQLWSGDLSGSIKYGTRTAYDLGVTTNNITESYSRDIGISASYSKRGFEVPLFGISLKNDIEISFSYTSSTNSVIIFDLGDKFTDAGTPQDGTLRTTLEPRIKYTISSKVTLSVFYKRTATTPQGAARITPTTTNEAGLDVHISIQ